MTEIHQQIQLHRIGVSAFLKSLTVRGKVCFRTHGVGTYLGNHPNKIISIVELINSVYKDDIGGGPINARNSIRCAVFKLRKTTNMEIKTYRRRGYQYVPN
jgi:hypothetical protein